MKKKLESVLLAAVAAFPLLAVGAAETVVLTPAETEVVVPANAAPVVRYAADELTNFLARAFGSPVAVGTEVEKRGGGGERKVRIFLGESERSRKEGLDANALKADGFFIKVNPDGDIFIVGKDDPMADIRKHLRQVFGVNPDYHRATLFGVYEFLERYAGCRFYFAGELGEVVPRTERLEIPVGLVRDEPAFVKRYASGPGGWDTWFGDDGRITTEGNRAKLLSLLRWRREGVAIPTVHGVRFMQLKRRFAKEHPEYFALRPGPDGKLRREADPADDPPTYAKRMDLCWSSPVVEEIAKDAIAYLKGESAASRGYKDGRWPREAFALDVVNIDCDDGLHPCLCDACQKRRADPFPGAPETRVIWQGFAKVGELVKAAGVKGRLFCAAYAAYQGMPDFPLPDNLLVGVARTGAWAAADPVRYRHEIDEMVAWSKRTGTKIHMHNWSLKWAPKNWERNDLPFFPCVTPLATGAYYAEMGKWAESCLVESTAERFAHVYLNNYVFAKMTWNLKTDYRALVDEHHRLMFGAAAPEMAELHARWEKLWLKLTGGRFETDNLGPVQLTDGPIELFHTLYSETELAEERALATRAKAKLVPGSLEARRVDLICHDTLDGLEQGRRWYLSLLSVEEEEARRRANAVGPNLLKGNWDCDFVVRAGAPAGKNRVTVPFAFETGAVYRVSCYVRAQDVKPNPGMHRYSFAGAMVALWRDAPRAGWQMAYEPGAITGSTYGWIHQEMFIRTEPGFKSKGLDLWLRDATGEMQVRGLRIEKLAATEFGWTTPDTFVEPRPGFFPKGLEAWLRGVGRPMCVKGLEFSCRPKNW